MINALPGFSRYIHAMRGSESLRYPGHISISKPPADSQMPHSSPSLRLIQIGEYCYF